jgi:cytoskeleton-associated protein 5
MIGDKDESDEGIRMLYDFRERHPGADLKPFLEKSSQFFQEYIESGLDKLEKHHRHERQSRNEYSETASGTTDGNAVLLGEIADEEDPNYYFERLKQIRAHIGIKPQTSADREIRSSSSSSSSVERRTATTSGFRSEESTVSYSSVQRTETVAASSNGNYDRSPVDENCEFSGNASVRKHFVFLNLIIIFLFIVDVWSFPLTSVMNLFVV